MSLPNEISEFIAHLKVNEPTISVQCDAPDNPEGAYYLDLQDGEVGIEVIFRQRVGFGFFIGEAGYGQRPDEIYHTPEKAATRALMLHRQLLREGHVDPLDLATIRTLSGRTQVEVAASLGITQPSVQRAEGQRNPKLGSVAGYINTLGGRLETRVVFDDMEANLDIQKLWEK